MRGRLTFLVEVGAQRAAALVWDDNRDRVALFEIEARAEGGCVLGWRFAKLEAEGEEADDVAMYRNVLKDSEFIPKREHDDVGGSVLHIKPALFRAPLSPTPPTVPGVASEGGRREGDGRRGSYQSSELATSLGTLQTTGTVTALFSR